jgi:hypothetical protein
MDLSYRYLELCLPPPPHSRFAHLLYHSLYSLALLTRFTPSLYPLALPIRFNPSFYPVALPIRFTHLLVPFVLHC